MKVLNIPIEPLEERYSIQWDKWFKEGFAERNVSFETIYGNPTSGKINTGSFLDVLETNMYKTSQLLRILEYLGEYYDDQEKLVLFFHDLWFPGLETIAYLRDGMGWKNLKICGCLHAGSYDTEDFLYKQGMEPWAMLCECAWFEKIVDKIFVATKFHKDLIISKRFINQDKIFVTGFPIYPDFVTETNIPTQDRLNIIVFPHRLNSEKDPDTFDYYAQAMPEYIWVKTKESCSTKQEYYTDLKKAKIALSFAHQETWGIAMQEAVLCGAIPICPNRLSYTEMYNSTFLYDDVTEVPSMIRMFINHPPTRSLLWQQKKILEDGREAIPNIIRHIDAL